MTDTKLKSNNTNNLSTSNIEQKDKLELSKKHFVFTNISKNTFDLAKQENETDIVLTSYINEFKIVDSNGLEVQVPGIYNKNLVDLGMAATIFINAEKLGVGTFKVNSYNSLGAIADSKKITIIDSSKNIE